eukprot:1553326-Pyramimonas_sp.AAC.1
MAPIAPCARSASSPSVLLPPTPPPSFLPPPLSRERHKEALPRIISRQQGRRHDVRGIFLTTCEP